VNESMPKNPMRDDEGFRAMQRGLMGAKKNKAMKNPMPRPKTSSPMVKAVQPSMKGL
jgi:hypothetical protein